VPQCEYLRVLRRRRPSEQGKPGQHLNKEPIDQTNRHDRRSSDVAIAQVRLDGRILDQDRAPGRPDHCLAACIALAAATGAFFALPGRRQPATIDQPAPGAGQPAPAAAPVAR
jgi:hypothetical protein